MQRQSFEIDSKPRRITFLGDSTIDNRVWVDGLIKSYFNNLLGIKRDSAATRVKKSHRYLGRPALSVVENVMDMLPNHIIHDYTNDGFTTRDVLWGEYRDKVFGVGRFSLFPHEWFQPLIEGASSMRKSQHIVISIGGNNFREFLMKAARKKGAARSNYIKDNLNLILAEMRDEYVSIIEKVRALNPHAQIILMTQYYPSASQNNYGIYPFMKEIGKLLNPEAPPHDPMTVIHEIMKMTYTNVLKRIPKENVVVADITSSLNPFDSNNHVCQIEPSDTGGKKIAKMLKYLMTSREVVSGRAYRFYPEFFTTNEPDQHVERTKFDRWVPAHPWDLKAGYSFEEENIFRKYFADSSDENALLQRFRSALENLPESSPMYEAAQRVREEAENTFSVTPECDLKKWKMSVVLALNVLETPKGHPHYSHAVRLLKHHANHGAIGTANSWKKLMGALAALAGAAMIGLSVAGIPFTGGVSLIGLDVAGTLMCAGGALFFNHHRQKSLAKETANLAKVAHKPRV